MKNEKICEYLSDIGILLFENIDLFLKIYSSNNINNLNSEKGKLKNSLLLYLQNTIKEEKLLNSMSNNIIETYYNTKAINKYKSLKNVFNILNQKIFSNYNYFIARTSLYIIKKSKHIIKFEPLIEKDNKTKLKRNNSDDILIIKEKKEIKKDFKEKNKENINKPKKKKKINKIKKNKKYKNNWYRNINDEGVIQHGFFVNNNDNLDKFNNIDKYNIKNDYIEDYEDNLDYLYSNYNNKYTDEINNIPNNYNPHIISNNLKSANSPINYYIPMYNHNDINTNNNYFDNNLKMLQNNHISMEQYISIVNTNSNITPDPYLNDYEFFQNQEKHEQRVKNKILNLQNEKLQNIQKECTFSPKINSPISQRIIPNYIIDNKFEKLYNDSIMNKIKKEQKIKKHLEEFKFRPNLQQTENYIVFSTFQERLQKSINMKEKRKNSCQNNKEKISANKGKKGEKKKSVIDWEKVVKENNEKYKNENHYGNKIEKKKKNLENIASQIDASNNNNIFIKEISVINNKEEPKEESNIFESNKLELDKEEKKENIEVENDINEKYQSSSIKNLLNNNNLLKKEY